MSAHGENRYAYIALGRPRHRWEDDIKMNLTENGFGMWIGLIWLRIGPAAGSCEYGNEPSVSIKGGEFLDYLIVLLASQEGLCSMKLVAKFKCH
jgi:hypothetical protein